MEVLFGQQSTKVKQLSDLIEKDILEGKYKEDNSLPSINSLSRTYQVSRDTVFKAFADLRAKKLIDSTPGKGYYVIDGPKKVFLLLDEYSPFKHTLYNSFIKNLGSKYKVDLWFHQYNEHIFNTILNEAIGRYNYYVVMNFDNERFSPLLTQIPSSKLLLLDFGKFEKKTYSYVCQDFDNAFYRALSGLTERLKRYEKIVFLYPEDSRHPESSVGSLKSYCKDHGLKCEIVRTEEIGRLEQGVAYIVIRQIDVVNVIKRSRELSMKCGYDFGLIAYNDTPAYQVIDEGITALSIDWEEMGRLASRFVAGEKMLQVYLPTEVHLRHSL